MRQIPSIPAGSAIPCDVLNIKILEPHWYSVTQQMDEWWEQYTKQGMQ
jgi:hypothetical protein